MTLSVGFAGRLIKCMCLILAAVSISSAAAQGPRARPGRFEVPGMDFRPDGAWRRRAAVVRATRHQLLRARAISALNARLTGPASSNRLTGTFFIPVLPVAFRNTSFPFAESEYQDALFNPAPTTKPYSVKTYYEELSNQSIALDGVVLPKVTADSNDVYYEDGCNGIGIMPCGHPVANGGSAHFGQFLIEALQKSDNGSVDWGQFDNDGPDGLPNSGDDDGKVDFITFLQPEVDGACGTTHIWAHRFVISAWNAGSPYVTQSPRRDQNGQPLPGQFIQIEDYTMQSGVGGDDACTDLEIMPIGTIAHETGHAFGLPDLYDTEGPTEGIGEWGLMGSGNYALPYSPSRYEAWSANELGWVTLDTLTSSRTVTLSPVSRSDTVLYVPIQGNPNEFFLLENRQPLESDNAQMETDWGFPSHRKAPGLLVWHIDQTIVDAHGFRNGDNRVNVGPVQGVALLQADGLNQLRRPPPNSNRGDIGDAYPGSTVNRRLSALTNPALLDNLGQFAGFAIDSIFQVSPSGPVTFRFLRRARSVIAADNPFASIRVNGAPLNRYSDVVAPGDQLSLDADAIQVLNNGHSNATFLSWSNGGPRTQTVVSGAQPDTIIAAFALTHLVQVTVVGGGSVAGTPAGDYTAGISYPAGTAVTLVASAPPGLVFASWAGDTVVTGDTLHLTVNHPFLVNAVFTTAVPVTLNAAVSELLGTIALADSQRVFLDVIGNKNGQFDVGDFLAYLHLTGRTLSPPVLAKILAGTSATSHVPSPQGAKKEH